MFSIHDYAAGAYLPPFFMHNEAIAERAFRDCINDPTHAFSKHPSDYVLMLFGEFDDNTGKLTDHEGGTLIANGISLVDAKSKPQEHTDEEYRAAITAITAERAVQ
nr:MAG: nonstructural protein [Microvirus sp.]